MHYINFHSRSKFSVLYANSICFSEQECTPLSIAVTGGNMSLKGYCSFLRGAFARSIMVMGGGGVKHCNSYALNLLTGYQHISVTVKLFQTCLPHNMPH